MNPKRDFTESKTEIIEQIDFYTILGIKHNATKIEIKRAYQKKLKKFHPDKTEPTKENKLKYKLIREAGDTLSHTQKRKAYDSQFKMNSEKQNFTSQKKSFNDFIKLQENSMTDEDRKIAKLNFNKSITQMNIEHGTDIDISPLSNDEYNRKMEDLILQREQEEFDLTHDNIFKDKKFNSSEFNNMFENKKQKDIKKKSDGMVLFKETIIAYDGNTIDGTSLDNYSSLYACDKYNGQSDIYAGVDKSVLDIEDNSDSDVSIESLDEADHKLEQKELDTEIKNMISERVSQDDKFTHMTNVDFGSALDDEFGISKQFGFMIGNDRNGQQKTNKSKITKSTIKIYKELTQD
jgi:curved DNA-binding protein CbpA